MQAKIFFITLAVADLSRSAAFYRDGLGWPTKSIAGQQFHDEVTGADGTIAIFTLRGGCRGQGAGASGCLGGIGPARP